MNFYAICNQIRIECGVSGTQTTVVGATGEWLRIVGWAAQAWVEAQEIYPSGWQWMDKTFTFDTTANIGSYTPAAAGVSDFAKWQKETFRIFLTANGINSETYLWFMEYEAFRNLFLFGTNLTNYSYPINFTIAPDKKIVLGLPPNDIYTVHGRYFSDVTELTDDADIPDMPSRFHWLLVYKAMMDYAGYESAPEVYDRGEKGYKRMLTALRLDQGPKIHKANSLI